MKNMENIEWQIPEKKWRAQDHYPKRSKFEIELDILRILRARCKQNQALRKYSLFQASRLSTVLTNECLQEMEERGLIGKIVEKNGLRQSYFPTTRGLDAAKRYEELAQIMGITLRPFELVIP